MLNVNMSQEDFGTLCICALRYCQGRHTYMPSLVQEIVGKHLKDLSDIDVTIVINDCESWNKLSCYGDNEIDKQDWLRFGQMAVDELKARLEKKHDSIRTDSAIK